MRAIQLCDTQIVTSRIGLGCASLGSRISAKQGRRAVEAAFDLGVTWFDVAPAYGAGRAEKILAPFLAAHRDRAFICSKVGLAPPRRHQALKAAYDFGRPLARLFPGLRQKFRAMSATRNQRRPLTPELIETAILGSLTRLGVDHLDVYALHDPDPADLDRDEILRALERVKARGQTRHLGVAGSLDGALKAARLPMFGFLQLADDPETGSLARLRAALDRPAAIVSHSVLGIGAMMERIAQKLRDDPALRRQLADAGYDGAPDQAAKRLLLRRAFDSNSDGVILLSMFSKNHLAENVALAKLPVDPHASKLVEAVLASGR